MNAGIIIYRGSIANAKRITIDSAPQADGIEHEHEDESAVPLRDSMKERDHITDLRGLAEGIQDDNMCPDIIPGE